MNLNNKHFTIMPPIQIDNKIKISINKSILCWLATASGSGMPNVSPKEIFVLDKNDDFLIANIASPNSVKNIGVNKYVCVSFIDIFKQKGYKIKGVAEIILPVDIGFNEMAKPLKHMMNDKFIIQSIIKIMPTYCKPILAPSYLFDKNTNEKNQIKNAMNSYHVKPL